MWISRDRYDDLVFHEELYHDVIHQMERSKYLIRESCDCPHQKPTKVVKRDSLFLNGECIDDVVSRFIGVGGKTVLITTALGRDAKISDLLCKENTITLIRDRKLIQGQFNDVHVEHDGDPDGGVVRFVFTDNPSRCY